LQERLTASLNTLRQENPALDHPGHTDVSHAVTQVVHYLQDSRRQLKSALSENPINNLNQNLVSNELQAFLRMAQLVDLNDPVNPFAAQEVVSLLEMMGQLLDLPAWRLQRLRLAGMLYRIAPAAQNSAALVPESEAPSCPLVAEVQALRLMPRMRAIALIIAHREEAWNGDGHPAQLKEDAIPLESRMLGLVSAFQERLAQLRHETPSDADENQLLTSVLNTCQAEAGERWDPKLVDILSLMVKGLQQGLSLPTIPTKITLGSGLLNPDLDDIQSVSNV
jgi:HD-GYP domain-containing protein (c-di-GMP phosphodiesterase class II)